MLVSREEQASPRRLRIRVHAARVEHRGRGVTRGSVLQGKGR